MIQKYLKLIEIVSIDLKVVNGTCQNIDPKLTYFFDFPICNKKFNIMFGKYYYLSKDNHRWTSLKIVDAKTGKLIKVVKYVSDFFIDSNYNIIVSNSVGL